MKKQILTYALLVLTAITYAQSVGINTNTPDTSAALDVASTTQGMLVPRMFEAQRTAIGTPATGLLVYQTDATAGFYFYNGTAWASLNSGAASVATDNTTLEGNGTTATPIKIKNAGVTTAQMAPSATNGQVLTTTAGNVAWETPSAGGGGGITQVTKAVKDGMTSAALNTLVYQTDEFKGIYAKETDGWRSQSGDTPILFINVGNIGNGPYTGNIYQLNASHHTIYVEGEWDALPFDLFTLPLANTCKGRKYTFIILTKHDSQVGWGQPWEENGYGVNFSNSDAYIRLDKKPTDTMPNRKISLIPTHRQFTVQSDGTDWREIENDKGNPEYFKTIGSDE